MDDTDRLHYERTRRMMINQNSTPVFRPSRTWLRIIGYLIFLAVGVFVVAVVLLRNG